MFVDVGSRAEFDEGKLRVVTVNGRQIGVLISGEEVFALRNVCPHEYGPVCEGFAMPRIFGDEVGSMDVDEERLVVVCPWHGWEFEARTGRASWSDESTYRLKTYPAKLEDGRVFVDPGAAPRGKEPDPGSVPG